jgi:phosphoadenosine phosphosulfate reductase
MKMDKNPKNGEMEQCDREPIYSTTLYWCDECNTPIFDKTCPICGKGGKYIATDIRPVFPEEKVLVAILLDREPLSLEESSVWHTGHAYVIDGKKVRLSIGKTNKKPLEEIKIIKEKYDSVINQIDYTLFDKLIETFVEANKNRYNDIVDESISYVQSYQEKYSLDDMFVSFSGGKDSTVTSDIVTRAFSTNEIIHIFGDTTLEFPLTYDYKKRFSKVNRVRTAKNYDKDFEELCTQIGPPSRVMRWCCTVFKTGAITKKINQLFKDKTNVLTFYGIRKSESASRSKYERESESPKITKQTVVSPIIDWIDFDVWLYILTTKIDFNDAYRLGFSRVGCWCCPNNGAWSEFLSKVHMFDKYDNWRNLLVNFATDIGKPDPEEYIDSGNWKARQGGNGIEMAQKSIVSFEPCATEDNAFNYELQRPISEELYELFKPFGYLNFDLGNKRLGEVYVLDRKGAVVLVLQGRIGTNQLKVTIKKTNIAKSRNLQAAEGKIQCQLTKYQMCLACGACESVCKHNAIIIKEDKNGDISYKIDDEKCVRCGECVAHFTAGCYMRKVLTIKRG